MRKILCMLILSVFALGLPALSQAAKFSDLVVYGKSPTIQNITVYDGRGTQLNENGETEPRMINNHNWDLEAFLYDPLVHDSLGYRKALHIVSGFNLVNGYQGIMIGDLFVRDVSGDKYALVWNRNQDGSLLPSYTAGTPPDNGWLVGGFSVYEGWAPYVQVSEPLNQGFSDPYRLDTQGLSPIAGGAMALYSGVTDVPFLDDGQAHYVMSIYLADIGSWVSNTEWVSLNLNPSFLHLTMGCGNDLMHGHAPEPATMLLLGTGLAGLAGLRRRFKR